MFNTPCIDTFRDGPAWPRTARITQMLEATRASLDRVAHLRAYWEQSGPEARGLDAQTELIDEMANASAYLRYLAVILREARRDIECPVGWDSDITDIEEALREHVDWMRSVGIPWPRT